MIDNPPTFHIPSLPDGEQIVAVSETHYTRVLDVLETAFPKTPRSFFYTITRRDPAYRPDFSLAVVKDNRYLAHLQILDRTLLFDGQPLRVGGIGSVGTRPECRGRGYATALLNRATEIMDQEKMKASILFTGIHPFYERLGWKSVPQSEQEIPVSALKNYRPPYYTYRRIRESDYPVLQEMYALRISPLTGPLLRTTDYWPARAGWMFHTGVALVEQETVTAYFYAAIYDANQPIMTVTEFGYRQEDEAILSRLLGAMARKAEEMNCSILRGFFYPDEAVRRFGQSQRLIAGEKEHPYLMWKDVGENRNEIQIHEAVAAHRFLYWPTDAF